MHHIARTPVQIGAIVRRERKARGWTQHVLGRKAGFRQETISLIENGSAGAKLDTVLSILAALELEASISSRAKGQQARIEDIF